ncbi:hypothetical protein [Acidocella sp.]|uniref:Vgb family protein n=1 Tax=Acidocella sp. TaxID=50710 RepID=UPI003CFDFC27
MCLSTTCAPVAHAAAPAYSLAQSIPLMGSVKWDYLHFHAATGQLFIAHGKEVTVVDTGTGEVKGNVTGLHGTHGIAFDPATGQGYTDSSGTKTLSVFNPATLQVSKTLPSLDDTDGMVFDAASHDIFVAAGNSQAVLVLDPASDKETKIDLPGKPEYLVPDGQGQLYVALNDKNQIASIDTKTATLSATWALPGCEAPTGMAMDAATNRIFTSCQNGKLAVVNAMNGKEVALLPIGKGSDSAAFDAKRKLIFSANSIGTLSVIREIDADHFKVLPAVKTQIGARTLAVDEANGDVFLVTGTPEGKGIVKHAGFAPRYKFAPGSLRVLVYKPAT